MTDYAELIEQLNAAPGLLGKKAADAIEALKADAERLDWMDKSGKSNVFSIVDKWYTRPDYGQPYTKHKTLRAAIDAARSKT